jgi:hypothetical protein
MVYSSRVSGKFESDVTVRALVELTPGPQGSFFSGVQINGDDHGCRCYDLAGFPKFNAIFTLNLESS